MKNKLIIVTTVPISLGFFKGQVQELKKKFEVKVLSSPGTLLDEFCQEEKVVGFGVPIQREISIFKDIRSLFHLLVVFLREKPTVVHGNTPKGGLLSMFASWLLRVPTRIYYLHGLRYEGTKGKKRTLLMEMERFACFFATDVYAVSHGVKSTLERDNITRKPITVIHNGSVNGLNTSYFQERDHNEFKNPVKLPSDAFVFGFVGRMVGDKGINELVEAFEQLKNHKAYLLLVGPLESDLDPLKKETLERIRSNNKIVSTGGVSDVRPYLMMMNVFVFPSYREGFGISLMEALAMGLPVISSDITGCNEIVQHGENGLLIPSKGHNALLDTMSLLLENKRLFNKLKENARRSVVERYEQKKVWQKTLESYSRFA